MNESDHTFAGAPGTATPNDGTPATTVAAASAPANGTFATAAPAVSVSAVSFSYPNGHSVLEDLELSVPQHRVTAILGPNGVGKTTLLNMLLGWLQPTKGTIHLFGEDIHEMTRRDAGQTVSLVPQDEHVPFDYTLLDYVLLGRSPYLNTLATPGPDDRTIAENALLRVGLGDRACDSVNSISGGEKQLVLLARSLCQEPRLLLLDEPSAHLDLANKRRLVNLIHDLRSSGVSVVLTAHDPDFAATTADEIIVLSAGSRLVQGPPQTTLTSEHLSAAFGISLTVQWRDRHPHILW